MDISESESGLIQPNNNTFYFFYFLFSGDYTKIYLPQGDTEALARYCITRWQRRFIKRKLLKPTLYLNDLSSYWIHSLNNYLTSVGKNMLLYLKALRFCRRRFKLFIFLSSPIPLDEFRPNFAHSILGSWKVQEIQVW